MKSPIQSLKRRVALQRAKTYLRHPVLLVKDLRRRAALRRMKKRLTRPASLGLAALAAAAVGTAIWRSNHH